MLGNAGAHAEARKVATRSVELGRALDARGADLGALLYHQAIVLLLGGDLESSVASFAEAHAAYVAVGDAGHAASALGALGGARAELAVHRDDAALEKVAIAELERAVIEIEKEWEANHPDRATALYSLALVHAERARCDDAMVPAKQAIAIFEREAGSALVADPLVVLGRCLFAKGARADAIVALERAIAVLAKERDPRRHAAAEGWLGVALLGTEQDDRARVLLTSARETLATHRDRHRSLLDAIDRALAESGATRRD